MLKRFLVFAGYNYYPSAAMGDFKEDADILEDAQCIAQRLSSETLGQGWTSRAKYDWVRIYDSKTKETF